MTRGARLGAFGSVARGALVVAALGAVPGAGASVARAEGAAATKGPGPRAREPAPGAAVARSFAELDALVRDPAGPREIELAAGVHHGDLVVRRPLAVRGAAGAVLEGSGGSTVVTVDANDVTVENLVLRGSGRRHTTEDAGVKVTGERNRIAGLQIEDSLFGVALNACRHCVVERVKVIGFGDDAELRGDGIKLWESHDSVVRDTEVDHARDMVVWYTRRATLDGVVVTRSRYGAHFMYAHDCAVRGSRFERNVVGVFVMYSLRLRVEDNVLAGARGAAGMGLGFKDSDAVEVSGNWLVANTTGTYLDNTPRTPSERVTFARNFFALNDVALSIHSSEKGVAFTGNDFGSNATMVEVDGGGDALGLEMRGNHYSDYEGYDLDRDGVGDVAYEVKALSSELTESHPALKLFNGTAAMALVDTVARAVPVLASRKLLVDPAPLAASPHLREPRRAAP